MFMLGIINAIVGGFTSVLYKKRIENMPFADFQKTYSVLNACLAIPCYFILSKVVTLDYSEEVPVSLGAILFLLLFLVLRIVSNTAQGRLLKDKSIDVNIITILMSVSCFLSLIGTTSNLKVNIVCSMLTACFGVLLITVDFKAMEFKFKREALVFLIAAFIANGTRTAMCSYLLTYFTPIQLSMMEFLNYMLVYLVMFKEGRITLDNVKKIIPLTFIAIATIVCSYLLAKTITLAIATSFVSAVSVAVFSIIMLKSKLSKVTWLGIGIVICSLTAFRMFS